MDLTYDSTNNETYNSNTISNSSLTPLAYYEQVHAL